MTKLTNNLIKNFMFSVKGNKKELFNLSLIIIIIIILNLPSGGVNLRLLLVESANVIQSIENIVSNSLNILIQYIKLDFMPATILCDEGETTVIVSLRDLPKMKEYYFTNEI
jgi:hypothetical protein